MRLRVLAPFLVLALVAGGKPARGAEAAQVEFPADRLPPRLESRFAEALRTTRRESFGELDGLLNRVRAVEGAAYSWRHYYTYCAAVQAAFVGVEARARLLLDDYLGNVGALVATNQVPAAVLTCPALKSTRKLIAAYREKLSQQWGDDRWSLHNFGPDRLAWEYESALALRCRLTPAPELPAWAAAGGSARPGPPWTCQAATVDTRRLLAALRSRQLGHNATFRKLLAQLRDSDSPWPAPEALLARVESPPRVWGGFRRRGLWAAGAILAALLTTIIVLRVRRRRRGGARDSAAETESEEFNIARADPFVAGLQEWLDMGPWGVAAAGLVFIGGAHWLLAWSEDALWPQGCVVDRSFLDYFSFPYSFALLIPAFLGGSLLLYSSIRRWLPGVLRVSLAADGQAPGAGGVPAPVLVLWRKYAAFCNSRFLAALCLAEAVGATVAQKIQWGRDPGTAFVDLRYPGHWSVTAVYHTIVSVVMIYCVVACLIRGGAVLSFVSQVYTRRWRERRSVRAHFDYTHPDGCAGLQPLGWILLQYYVLLLLLAAQILLNLLEKFRFYESLHIVLQHTLVSVGGFALVFALAVPYLVGRPLLTVHLAMRQFRRREALRVSRIADAHRETLLNRAEKGEASSADARVFQALLGVEEEIHTMPLWPMDLKVALYFVASHLVPLFSFIPALLERWFGIKIG